MVYNYVLRGNLSLGVIAKGEVVLGGRGGYLFCRVVSHKVVVPRVVVPGVVVSRVVVLEPRYICKYHKCNDIQV